MIVAGIDIGFAHTGISLFAVANQTMEYLDSECYTTKKVKGSKASVAQQDADRILLMITSVIDYLKSANVDLVIIELPVGGARSSRSARALAISTAMSVFIPYHLGCKYIFVTPREVKLATTGNPNAEKKDIIKAMGILFPNILKHNKGKQEHISDSIGCVIARLDKI